MEPLYKAQPTMISTDFNPNKIIITSSPTYKKLHGIAYTLEFLF